MPGTLKKHVHDRAVQGTNDASIVSKESMERLGYTRTSHHLAEFASIKKRRAPLINRGYYVRTAVLDYLIDQFLNYFGALEKLQVVSLGCGFDPTAFRLADIYARHEIEYYDIDFGDVVSRKRAFIESKPELINLLGNKLKYNLLSCDLRQTKDLEALLAQCKFDREAPTLVLVECVFTYISPKFSSKVISLFSDLCAHCQMVVYEQVLPHGEKTGFSETMMAHFDHLSSPLLSLEAFPSKAHQKERFAAAKFAHTQVFDLYEFWTLALSATERQRILDIEPFDEWEEWYMYCSHYMIANARNGRCKDLQVSFDGAFPAQTSFKTAGVALTNVSVERTPVSMTNGSSFFLSPNKIALLGGFGTLADSAVHSRLRCMTALSLSSCPTVSVTQLSKESPAKLFGHVVTMNVPAFGSVTLAFGGRESPNKATSDAFYLDKVTHSWCLVEVIGEMPEARYRSGACSDGATELYIYGGRNNQGAILNDLWVGKVTVAGSLKLKWQCLSVDLPPIQALSLEHVDTDTLWLIGGLHGKYNESEAAWADEGMSVAHSICEISISKNSSCTWRPVQICNVEDGEYFAPRFGHKSLKLGRFIVVAGGCGYYHMSGSNQSSQVACLCRESGTWTCLSGPFSELDMLVGSSLISLNSENRFAIAGGGATCFSMGSCFNNKLFVLQLPENLLDILLKPATGVKTVEFSSFDEREPLPVVVNEPLLVKNVPFGNCSESWTSKIFHSSNNPDKVIAHVSRTPYLDFCDRNFEYQLMPWATFAATWETPPASTYLYLRALATARPKKDPCCLYRDFPYLANDFELPCAFNAIGRDSERYFSSVLRISSASLRLWTHYDVMDNVLFNVLGRKKVLMWHPWYTDRLGVTEGSSSPISDLFLLDSDVWRARIEILLEPGDALFIPSCWFHHVTSLEPSVSVNMFYTGLPKTEYGITKRDLYGNIDLRCFENAIRYIDEFSNATEQEFASLAHFILANVFETIPDFIFCFDLKHQSKQIANLATLKKIVKLLKSSSSPIHQQFYALKLLSILKSRLKA